MLEMIGILLEVARKGVVNPFTPDGIDRTVAKANRAQTGAKTTFKQRRRVLKTLLLLGRVAPRSTGGVLCEIELTAISYLDILSTTGSHSYDSMSRLKTKIDASLTDFFVTVQKPNWTIQRGEK